MIVVVYSTGRKKHVDTSELGAYIEHRLSVAPHDSIRVTKCDEQTGGEVLSDIGR